MTSVRALFLWSRWSGYMAACWHALSQFDDIRFRIISIHGEQSASDPTFNSKLLEGLDVVPISATRVASNASIDTLLGDMRYNVVVMSGWSFPAYRKTIREPRLAHVPLVICSDNQLRHSWRQLIGRYRLRALLRRAALCVVPGERACQLMRYYGVASAKIRTGLYGVDGQSLSGCIEARNATWPKSFLFIGRYTRRKGVDLLLEAYERYRCSVENPWNLYCAGRGELASDVIRYPSVVNLGFVEPTDLPTHFVDAGVFVLPSRSDAWPLAIVEACASGLPILCTSACGSSVELVRHGYNGFVCDPSTDAVTAGLVWLHNNYNLLPKMGQRSQLLANCYHAEQWARLWRQMLLEVSS